MPTLTVAQNLLLGIEPHSPRELHNRAQELLDACEIPTSRRSGASRT